MMLVWGKAEVKTEFESDLKTDFATVIEFDLHFCRNQDHETPAVSSGVCLLPDSKTERPALYSIPLIRS
jgi:hypothetical protein